MPELPDITTYVDALDRLLVGKTLQRIDIRSPFLIRSVKPDLQTAAGRTVQGFRHLGKRIVWELERDLFLVFHLMIAGRFHWRSTQAKARGKMDLAAFTFDHGVMMLTEASSKKRTALYVVDSQQQLASHDPGGLDVLTCSETQFRVALLRENHTLKRALTDPSSFGGIGNVYSDEILHVARLSPLKWTQRLTEPEVARLFESTQSVLTSWTAHLLAENGGGFPEKVTAFREGMAVHGRFGKPCPICETAVQRIVYSEHETNYCPRCQTGGKLLADRSLSRLLKKDWPRTIDQWES